MLAQYISEQSTAQELIAERPWNEVTSHKNRFKIVDLHGFLPRTKALEAEFQADIGLPLLGMVRDGRRKATEKRIAENGARGRRAGW